MPEYIVDPIETDPDQLQRDAFDYIQTRWPDWEPDEGNLETWLIAACARMVAEAADVAADVPPAIFRYYGARVLGLPPIDPTSATVPVTWTVLTNPAGRVITAGTLVNIDDLDGNPTTWEVVSDVGISIGVLTTAAGEVTLRSITEGADFTGLGGVGIAVEPQDTLSWYGTVTLTAATQNGIDGEDDQTYLDRLSSRLTLLTPRPILPRDFELLAKDIAAQNGAIVRVLAIDLYDPGTDTYDNERMVALAMVDDATGANASGGIKTIVGDELQALREVNFVVNMMDPTRTPVDVTFVGTASPGADPAVVEAAAEAAVSESFISSEWGQPQSTTEERMWIQDANVRIQDVSNTLHGVVDFDHWTSITIGLSGGAQTAADHALPGAAPIAEPGIVAGTVT